MSRFSGCRNLTLEGVCRDCACDCAMRSHSLMRTTGDACIEASIITGSNVLQDPGFEKQFVEYGGGPNGDNFPVQAGDYDNGIPWIWPATDANYTEMGDHSYWVGVPGYYFNNFYNWRVVTSNPHSGTYHARTGVNGISNDLYCVQKTTCSAVRFSSPASVNDGYTGACINGSVLDFSVWAMNSTLDNPPSVRLGFYILNKDFIAIQGGISSSQPLTTAYAQYSYSQIVSAASAKYFIAYITCVSSLDRTVDVDDASVIVT